MSKKTKVKSKLRGLAKRVGNSHKTKSDYMNIMSRIVELAYGELATPIHGPEDLTEEFLKRLVAYWSTRIKPRTIHNYISVVRGVLHEVKLDELADSKRLRSRDLGTPPGSRDGTNSAIEDSPYAQLIEAASRLNEPGLVPILKLERTIGLRRQEGVMAGPTLAEWEQCLVEGRPLAIRHGAKNGRPREAVIPNVDEALAAVREAAEVATKQGGHLIPRESLEAALSRYSYLMWKYLHTKGHSLRYSYSKDLYFHNRSLGLTEDDAWPLVSMALGHGKYREDLMRNVYLRGVIPKKSRKAKGVKST